MAQAESTKAIARTWLRREQRSGNRAARPVLVLHVTGLILGIGQAFAAASVLTAAFGGGVLDPADLTAFGVFAVLRAGLSYLTEKAAFSAGAAARRRLRSDALSRLLHAGPALLRERHSGDLATIVVDKIEALDGLFSRYVPAATFAVVGPAVVLLAVLYADPWAAAVAAGLRPAGACRHGGRRHWRRRGLAQPVPGPGAAAGPVPRPRARHRDHRAVRPRRGRSAVAGAGGRRTAGPHDAGAARRVPVLRRAGPGRRSGDGGAGDPLFRPAATGGPGASSAVLGRRWSCCC